MKSRHCEDEKSTFQGDKNFTNIDSISGKLFRQNQTYDLSPPEKFT